MKQELQIVTNVKSACDVAVDMMNTDNYEEKKRGAIISAIQMLLNSQDYINMIKSEINSMIKDKKIDLNDYPKLLVVITESNSYIEKMQQQAAIVKSDFDIDAMKYIIFAVIYFGLLVGNVDESSIDNFKIMYPTLWKLLKVNPNKIAKQSKSLFGKLCQSMSCKK